MHVTTQHLPEEWGIPASFRNSRTSSLSAPGCSQMNGVFLLATNHFLSKPRVRSGERNITNSSGSTDAHGLGSIGTPCMVLPASLGCTGTILYPLPFMSMKALCAGLS